jgi:hypothetical protein
VKRLVFACAASLAASAAAFAHHSPAGFDMTAEVVVEGTVEALEWKNPHLYLTIETVGADGATVVQEIEGGSLSIVRTFGLARELLTPGTPVAVRGNPSRRAGGMVRGLDVAIAGGVYALNPEGRDTAPPAVTPATGLAGRWAASSTDFTALVAGSRAWPLTEAARAGGADAYAIVISPGACQPWPLPMLTALPYLRVVEIGEAAVVIRYDASGVDAVRTVRLDLAEHPADVEPTLLGHSIGRWEGDALVIDTVGFAPHHSGLAPGAPSGPRKHMVERLSLTEDGLHLRHELTLEDPDHLAEPVSIDALWDHRPDLEPSSPACDPENALRFLEDE